MIFLSAFWMVVLTFTGSYLVMKSDTLIKRICHVSIAFFMICVALLSDVEFIVKGFACIYFFTKFFILMIKIFLIFFIFAYLFVKLF